MNTQQLALSVGLHPKTVARFARENKIPGQFVGGRHGWLFELEPVKSALVQIRGNKAARKIGGAR